MTTVKTPVRYVIRWQDGNLHGGHFEDADSNLVKNDDIADALNATTPAPDLTALREAVEAYHAAMRAWRPGDVAAERDVYDADTAIINAALALFPTEDGA